MQWTPVAIARAARVVMSKLHDCLPPARRLSIIGFNFIEFNQLEYTPKDVEGNPVNGFGATLRELTVPQTVSDTHDNYKLTWYSGYWNLARLIEERFGKNVNT